MKEKKLKQRNVFVEKIIERGGHSVMPNKKKKADKRKCRGKIEES